MRGTSPSANASTAEASNALTPQRLNPQRQDGAKGAYLLGICLTRPGDFAEALKLMWRAQAVNPEHVQTSEQVEAVERLIAEETWLKGIDDDEGVFVVPRCGCRSGTTGTSQMELIDRCR